mgnify:CR=1 FL=1
MKALLLAAGLGTRLRPLTNSLPKCLMPIKGRPLLEIWLDHLSEAGIGPFLINTHYRSEQVNQFVRKSRYRNKVTLVYESELLGTAGTLRANKEFFDGGDGMLIHTDNYCLLNINEFIDAHINRCQDCLMTMMAFKTDEPNSCGIMVTDENGVVIGFHEKVSDPPGNLANAAVYILSSEMISELPEGRDFSTEIIPSYLNRIQSYRTDELMIDIGTPEKYRKACSLAK